MSCDIVWPSDLRRDYLVQCTDVIRNTTGTLLTHSVGKNLKFNTTKSFHTVCRNTHKKHLASKVGLCSALLYRTQ
jgi:hypothetical protein